MYFSATAFLVMAAFFISGIALAQEQIPEPRKQERLKSKIRAVVVDPADYLADEPDASALAKKLVKLFKKNNVNLIYVNAFNVQYGAYYKTKYKYNFEGEYGRQDFLGKLIRAAHREKIKVFAALYDHQHRGAWEAKPSWRSKTRKGGDYNPPLTDIQYYLSVGHPEAKSWWMGFLKDLLENYPELNGIELREPIINWGGAVADYNPAMNNAFKKNSPNAPLGGREWHDYRKLALTRFLKEEISLIKKRGLSAHVTNVVETFGSGKLFTAEEQAQETGFDLNALLDGKDRPDAIKIQLIWQQWARVYDYIVFTPEWTGQAAKDFLGEVAGRVPTIVHIELTDFGLRKTSVEEFYTALVAADTPGVAGLDFYSSFLASKKGAWPAINAVYRRGARKAPPGAGLDKRVLILYDEAISTPGSKPELSRLFATNLANLLGHFNVKWKMQRIEDYKRGQLQEYDVVFYNATVYNYTPQAFLSDVSVFEGQVVWIGSNLFRLIENGVRIPISQSSQNPVTDFNRIIYKGRSIPSKGSIIVSRAGKGVTVAAWTKADGKRAPYVLQNNNFWYAAGSPFEFIETLNGRYVAFSDLLHDMLKEFHPRKHQAFLRIEDVNPLTDPSLLRKIADVFQQRKVPFMVGLIPLYVNPDSKKEIALSDRPKLVSALRYMVQRGGAVILHGTTHQYKGVTGGDYEFWDPTTRRGAAKTPEQVQKRVEQAIEEAWANSLHPLAWETPHYSATPRDYALFGEYFSTFIEKRTFASVRGHIFLQPMPYMINNDIYGGRIISENLSYSRRSDRENMVASARDLLVVRDGIAGGLFQATTSPKLIGNIIDQIFDLNYTFIDLYDLPNVVRTPQGADISGYGRVELLIPSGFFLQESLVTKRGSVAKRKLERFEDYTRLSRTFSRVPDNGLYSFRVLSESKVPLFARIRFLAGRVVSRITTVPTEPLAFVGYLITTLAVLVMLTGLSVLIYVLFKRGLALLRR